LGENGTEIGANDLRLRMCVRCGGCYFGVLLESKDSQRRPTILNGPGSGASPHVKDPFRVLAPKAQKELAFHGKAVEHAMLKFYS